MHSSCVCYTSLWSQCYNLGLLQLVRFSFGNIMCAKKIRSADCPNVLNDQVFPSVDLFSTVMAQTYSKMTEPRFIWLKL